MAGDVGKQFSIKKPTKISSSFSSTSVIIVHDTHTSYIFKTFFSSLNQHLKTRNGKQSKADIFLRLDLLPVLWVACTVFDDWNSAFEMVHNRFGVSIKATSRGQYHQAAGKVFGSASWACYFLSITIYLPILSKWSRRGKLLSACEDLWELGSEGWREAASWFAGNWFPASNFTGKWCSEIGPG